MVPFVSRFDFIKIALVTFLACCLVSLPGCGGGTDGTGQSSSSISGVVRSASSDFDLEGLNLSLINDDTNQIVGATSTDGDGHFEFSGLDQVPANYRVNIEESELGLNIDTERISSTSDQENLIIVVDPIKKKVTEVTKVEPTAAPTPKATHSSGNTPIPATATPNISEPTATPGVVDPTATPAQSEPTAEPTATPASDITPCIGNNCGLATPTSTPKPTPTKPASVATPKPTLTPVSSV